MRPRRWPEIVVGHRRECSEQIKSQREMLQLIEVARILSTRMIPSEWNKRQVFVLTHFLHANRLPLRLKML
jgi:hypothetical protein